MVKVRKDLTGQRFGRLVVLKQDEDHVTPKGVHLSAWKCKCDCGNEVIVPGSYMKNGGTLSCGCLKGDVIRARELKGNRYDLSGEYGIGYTSKGEEFWFDLEDYEKINKYTWYYKYGYVTGNNVNDKRADGTLRPILLHRLVMGNIPKGMLVDHINHPKARENKYDNRKSNLRIVTSRENNINIHLRKDNTSGVTGVNKYHNKWYARISLEDGKRLFLGSFDNFEDAVKARKQAEEKYYGEYSFNYKNKEVNI